MKKRQFKYNVIENLDYFGIEYQTDDGWLPWNEYIPEDHFYGHVQYPFVDEAMDAMNREQLKLALEYGGKAPQLRVVYIVSKKEVCHERSKDR